MRTQFNGDCCWADCGITIEEVRCRKKIVVGQTVRYNRGNILKDEDCYWTDCGIIIAKVHKKRHVNTKLNNKIRCTLVLAHHQTRVFPSPLCQWRS